jgi:membrane associated rhomboid family serine protease
MREITPVVKQLLILNILFFVGTFLLKGLPNEILSLYYFENSKFRMWQPITHMFMHGGIAHIAFNMFALFSFGSTLEYHWGPKKFLFFYITCGLGAALVHSGFNYYFFNDGISTLVANGYSKQAILQILSDGKFNPDWEAILSKKDFSSFISSYASPALGASGAVYGLLIAFTFMFPNAELSLMFIPIPIKAKYFVPIYMLLYDGLFGIFSQSIIGINSNVAHFAHIGGAVVGFIIMWYWKKNSFNNRRWN